MDFSQSFSSLNERLKPRVTSSEQLYSSLNRMEDRQLGSLGSRTSYRPTVLPVDPKGSVIITEPHDPAEPEADAEQEDLVSDDLGKGNCADLRLNTCLLSELNLKDVGDEELADEDSSSTQSEEKDSQGELTTEGTTNSSSSEGGSSLQMSFVDGTLPDLLNSGKTLSRRRTLGHVSASLSEVRREVELSRRRSIKLKAQVDKLHENRSGKGWSQGRERVTEEVLSAVRLLQPLTEPGSSHPNPFRGRNGLDSALASCAECGQKSGNQPHQAGVQIWRRKRRRGKCHSSAGAAGQRRGHGEEEGDGGRAAAE
ncbi:uncharacterized protein LOC117774352 [Hippoglossus hippoglossus]|uniref:uncharacterized protein LOC117774352 n=1 Tax=Hippoglossus hippoglossus TaxID=8267 RepID=UPI00148C5600|nr:uncharacterized protein LOC117774352 [Hippoglossus hippoglossus]